MRDSVETAAGGLDSVDLALGEAGAAWRSSQPEPRPIDAELFAQHRTWIGSRGGRAWAFVAGASAAVAMLALVAITAPNLLPRLGPGYVPTGLANCPLTKPVPPFDAPISLEPPGGVFIDPPVAARRAWFGTDKLWTLLDRDGEVWTDLPKSSAGLGQKTFWWRDGYRPSSEPSPEIYVTGRRLDDSGSFVFGPGTNASFGLGSTMLVGIEVPTPGCWEIKGTYHDESLSYVVWVGQ